MHVPSQYLPIMPYLMIKKAKDFFPFLQKVFNASEQMMVPNDDGTIMHAEVRIFDGVVMFADAGESWPEKPAAMFLYVDNVDEIYKKALANQAKSLQAPEKKDYGYTAGFEDAHGNHWYIVQGD